jgi:hypothetical protein
MGVAQLEGALGDPGHGPGQDGPPRPQPGGSDQVEHLFLGAVDDDLDIDTGHDRLPFDLQVAGAVLDALRRRLTAGRGPCNAPLW